MRAVAALVALSTLLRFWAATRVHSLWILPDESIYGQLAQSLYRTGHLRILGEDAGFFGIVYPALAGLPLSLGDLGLGFTLLKALQALVVSLTAVPVYLWARTVAAPRWALVAAALTLTLPDLGYSALVMTEVAFTPLLVLTAWAAARALDRPDRRRQWLLAGAVLFTVGTRLQAVVLLPALATAALAAGGRAGLRRLAPALGGLAALALLWTGWRLRHGGPLRQVLGAYSGAADVHYGAGHALRFVLWHFGDLALLTGFAPLVAAILIAREPRMRVYAAVAGSLGAWLVLEVGVFAAGNVGYLAERNLVPLAPIVFVGLAAWLDRGGPRPRIAVGVACAAVLALVLALPAARLVTLAALPDSFTLVPFLRLREAHPHANLDLALLAAAGAGLLLLALPRRRLWLLPLVLGAAFAATSAWASSVVAREAQTVQSQTSGPDPRWIDAHARGDAVYLYTGEQYWNAAWADAFWNRRVRHVYSLNGASVPGGLPQHAVFPRGDGTLAFADGRPAAADYAVVVDGVHPVGRPVADSGNSLVLWRLDPPFRLDDWTQRGAEGDRALVHELVYGCTAGKLEVTLTGGPGRAEIRSERRVVSTLELGTGETTATAVAAAPPTSGGLCTFDVLTTAGVTASIVHFARKPS